MRRTCPPVPIALSALLIVGVLASGCDRGRTLLPGLTDASTCEDAREVVDVAASEARAFIGTGNEDAVLASELVFALSAVHERPECFDEETIRQAEGLRSSVNAVTG